jgi:poly(U)-specific endoribonuclease
MDQRVDVFYREIFGDLTVDREEAAELTEFLQKLQPPPDKLPWLRATAFKIGCEFITEDDHEKNVSLLRTINFIVHSIETVCMEPKPLENTVTLDEEAVEEFYKGVYDGLSVDQDENSELYTFFKETNPPEPQALVTTRALAFKVGCEHIGENKDTNVQLFRCINVVLHAFEMCCLKPKHLELKLEESVDLGMDISAAVQHLWNLDDNRLDPEADYTMNVQSGKKPFWKEDGANDPLFSAVDRACFQRPTYAAFIALLDNYSAETGVAEVVSDAERSEVSTFLNAVMETKPMQFCHQYCRAKDPNGVPSSSQEFKGLLKKIWFDLYRREQTGDSSGFEHVFVGEVKNGEVSGFHNWIQFYLEEQKGGLDYRGYIKPRSQTDALADANDYLLSLQFSWHGVEKFVSTSFIGVSPEFELALYTMCFLVGEEENDVELNTGGAENDAYGLKIKCYKIARDKVGTSFPEVTSHYED